MSEASATEQAEAADEGHEVREAEELHGHPMTDSHGQAVVHTDVVRYLALIEALRNDGYRFCADLTAVDYLTGSPRPLPEGVAPERFEVVVNLLDMGERRRLRVRCQVPGHDPHVPSLFPVFAGTEVMEREVFDLMGIMFDGHPDLTRIFMPDDWEGHPLRKDYSVGRVPVMFKDAPAAR